MPYPAPPRPQRVRTPTRLYDPTTGKGGSERAGFVGTGGENQPGRLSVEEIDFIHDPQELHKALMVIDADLQRFADQDDTDFTGLEELVRLTETVQNAFAVRLVQEDTPMRELTEDEKVKFRGLLDSARARSH